MILRNIIFRKLSVRNLLGKELKSLEFIHFTFWRIWNLKRVWIAGFRQVFYSLVPVANVHVTPRLTKYSVIYIFNTLQQISSASQIRFKVVWAFKNYKPPIPYHENIWKQPSSSQNCISYFNKGSQFSKPTQHSDKWCILIPLKVISIQKYICYWPRT